MIWSSLPKELSISSTNVHVVLMRVSLPVDPQNKTMSEVSTIELVRRNTDIPVPKIFVFDANNQNELGVRVDLDGNDARQAHVIGVEETIEGRQRHSSQAHCTFPGADVPSEVLGHW